MDNASQRRWVVKKENLNARCRVTSSELLVKMIQEVPKTTQAIATSPGSLLELDRKTLLLKIQHALVVGHKEIKLDLI